MSAAVKRNWVKKAISNIDVRATDNGREISLHGFLACVQAAYRAIEESAPRGKNYQTNIYCEQSGSGYYLTTERVSR